MEERVSSNKKIKAEYCIPKDRLAEILHVSLVKIENFKQEPGLTINFQEHKYLFSKKEGTYMDWSKAESIYKKILRRLTGPFLDSILIRPERKKLLDFFVYRVFAQANRDMCFSMRQAEELLTSVCGRFSQIKIRGTRGRKEKEAENIIDSILPNYTAAINSFRNECRHCLNEDCKLRGEACPELEESNEQKEFQS